jgi:hypothetical protein
MTTATATKTVGIETVKTTRRKQGLRAPQVRILKALSKAKAPLNQYTLCGKASVDPGWLPDALFGRIGDDDSKVGKYRTEATPLGLARAEKIGFPSLLALKLVKCKLIDVDGRTERVWEITPAGRKAVEGLNGKS